MEGTFLTVPQALLVAFCGLLIVFIMLAALCRIMYLLAKVLSAAPRQEAAPAPAPAAPTVPAAPAKVPAGQTYTGQVALVGVDEKTAACLMAIVSEETKIPLDELVFHKIEAL